MTDAFLMVRDTVHRTLLRDLAAMQREIAAYPDDAAVWRAVPGITNPGGTHALHIAGNLRHYIGAQLGGSDYVRDRPAEFAARGASREDIVAHLAEAVAQVSAALNVLDPTRLVDEYPEALGDVRLRTDVFLIHLAVHLGYHLGQLGYHRRITTGDAASVSQFGPRPLLADLPGASA